MASPVPFCSSMICAERDAVHVLEHGEWQRNGVARRGVGRAELSDAVVVEANQVGVGVRLCAELPQDRRLSLKPAERVVGGAVRAKDLDDDRNPVRLVVVALVNPTLPSLADELAQVEADSVGPLQDLPDQMVAKQGNARIGGVHGTSGYRGFPARARGFAGLLGQEFQQVFAVGQAHVLGFALAPHEDHHRWDAPDAVPGAGGGGLVDVELGDLDLAGELVGELLNDGESTLQGPHQTAVKSTRTGTLDLVTSSSQLRSFK